MCGLQSVIWGYANRPMVWPLLSGSNWCLFYEVGIISYRPGNNSLRGLGMSSSAPLLPLVCLKWSVHSLGLRSCKATRLSPGFLPPYLELFGCVNLQEYC